MATATKTADTVVCMEAHCNPATPHVVPYESEWAANDPVVEAAPHLFISKSAPRSQWKSPFDEVVAVNDERSRELEEARKAAWERRAKTNPVKLEAPRLVTAKRDVVGEFDGQPATVQKGSKLPADHPFVLEHGGSFA